MSLNLSNLDEETREQMLQEVDLDINNESLYLSPRLNEQGLQEYPDLLKLAISSGDDAFLANELRNRALLKTEEERRKPSGGFTVAKVPVTAPETLAEGEFNRFYIRGLCLRAITDGIAAVEVYRAKEVSAPRPESEDMIGQQIEVEALLEDVRTNIGVDTALGLPPGPNSGLSVRLPE